MKTLLYNKETAGKVSDALFNKILHMMLAMESKRAREAFTEGLQTVLTQTGLLKPEILEAIKDMNRIKKGMADLVLDFEKVLAALEKVNGFIDESKTSVVETTALLFNILNLLRSSEYSVRDYAQHSITKLIQNIPDPVFFSCEKWILTQVKLNHDELVIKSLLLTYKLFIGKQVAGSVSVDLYPLIDT